MNEEQIRKMCNDIYEGGEWQPMIDYITNLQQENKIKDTNWESLKYYLEKLYYKDYIEEAISDDIDKKIKELESKVEIKGYQKDIKALQQENERLKERIAYLERSNNRREDTIIGLRFEVAEQEDYKSRCEKAIPILNNIYMLDNVTITNNACEEIDKAINTLQNGSDDNE